MPSPTPTPREVAVNLVFGFVHALKEKVVRAGESIPLSDRDLHKIIPELARKCALEGDLFTISNGKCEAVSLAFGHPFSYMVNCNENSMFASKRYRTAYDACAKKQEIKEEAARFLQTQMGPRAHAQAATR